MCSVCTGTPGRDVRRSSRACCKLIPVYRSSEFWRTNECCDHQPKLCATCRLFARRCASSRTLSLGCSLLDAEPSVRDKIGLLMFLVVAWHWFRHLNGASSCPPVRSPHLGSAGPVILEIMQPRLTTRLSPIVAHSARSFLPGECFALSLLAKCRAIESLSGFPDIAR
jgi:hypothetical protein